MAPQGAVLLFRYNKTKGFEQGGSEAEENAPGGAFSPTWQRAKRGDRRGSAWTKSLRATYKNAAAIYCGSVFL